MCWKLLRRLIFIYWLQISFYGNSQFYDRELSVTETPQRRSNTKFAILKPITVISRYLDFGYLE